MKIKSITLQKIAVVCGGLGLFFGLGFAGNFENDRRNQHQHVYGFPGLPASGCAAGPCELCSAGHGGEAEQDPQGPEGHRKAQREAEGGVNMFHTTVKCADCGTVMVDVPSNTKRCAACRVGHNRESVRRANEAERARRAAEAAQPKPRNLDDDLEALKKSTSSAGPQGGSPLSYGVWRSRGAPEEYA